MVLLLRSLINVFGVPFQGLQLYPTFVLHNYFLLVVLTVTTIVLKYCLSWMVSFFVPEGN